MKPLCYKKYGKTNKITLELAIYEEYSNLAIIMITDTGEVWSNLTVNLVPTEKNHAFIDTNNNGEEILNWIVENNLGVITGRTVQSGYCIFPEVNFHENVLRDIDNEIYEEYVEILDIVRD